MRKRCSLAHKAITTLLIPSIMLASCQAVSPVQEVTVHQQAGSSDTDCDGIADNIELQYGLDPGNPDDAELDPDEDDVPSVDEIRFGGNPLIADTDGDGVRDDVDLQAGTDLDGDGMQAPFDNCPLDPNAAQADADGDHIGDACDPDEPGVRIAEAFARLDKDYALLPLAGGKTSRDASDRAELMPMPTSFRIFANTTRPGAYSLYELYHPTTKDHAYVASETERLLLLRRGYRDLGSIGAIATKPYTGGVLLRRFATTTQEAVTIDTATVQSLLAAGFVEKPAVGYVTRDSGHLRRPRSIVRYKRTGTGIYRHQATPVNAAGYTSEGPRFRLLPEKVSGARPLYRLRNGSLDERLSIDPAEIANYMAQGYAKDGILGWVLMSATAMPTQTKLELWRLERSVAHRYSVDAAEIALLTSQGWVKTRRLGYAFPGMDRAATCAGPTPTARLEDKLRGLAHDPDGRAVATLTAIVASCSLERVLDGNPPANVLESFIQSRLPADSETRRRMKQSVMRWHGIDPQLRAESLGKYAALDPGACTTPIDLAQIRDRAHDIFFTYSGPPPSLREPFCDGTQYGSTDPATGTAAESRAVTVNARPTGEFGDSNAANPRLMGVLATTDVRGHSALEAAANSNPDVGYSVEGIVTGIPCSTTSPCVASQGLRCVSGSCLAYPIVRNQVVHTFTGTNFWDVIDGDVVFRDTVTNQVSRIPNEIISNEPESDARCQPYGLTNRATIENPLSLTAGRFYEVEVVNKNGLYYEHAEDVPDDEATARANGRTIHVCWSPTDSGRPADTVTDCTLVRTQQAACPLDGPVCTATTGGVWGGSSGTRPRSLALCNQLGIDCGETPREISSRNANPNARQFIYVEASPPEKTITTSLQDVTCHNETGWDWTGSDEAAVLLTGFVGAAQTPTNPGVNVSSEGFHHSYDSGDNHTQLRQELTSLRLLETNDPFMGRGSYVLALMEEDSELWQTLAGLAVIVAVTAAVIVLWPALANPGAAIGVGAILSAAWVAIAHSTGADDTLGADTFSASISDVTDRGAQSHDLMYSPLAQLPRFDTVEPKYAGAYEVSVHPAVDGLGRQRNNEVTGVECTTNTDCASGEQCAIGLCVQSGWFDHEPGSGTNPPGFLERREFVNSDKWRYDLYLSWRVTQ